MLLLFRLAPDLLKASLPPGARWITVRPNGPGTEGQPVLIQPAGGDGGYRVIGGAGGKLNYLKLTGVRSEASYKEEARQSAVRHREERARQRERDKADGLDTSKARARESLKAAVGEQEVKFVQTVAKALGWTDADMRFPEEQYQNASAGARSQAAARHGRLLVKRAQEAVDQQRQRLVQDAEARSAAGIGEVPLTTVKPDEISVQDLDPVAPSTKGFGYATDYAKRAAQAGLTREGLAGEAQAAKPPMDDAEAAKAAARKVMAKGIADELQAIRDPGPQVDPRAIVDARQAVDLLKAEKMLKAARSDAREKGRLIDAAKQPVEPKAYILETGGPVDADVVRDLESDLRTLRTRAFLETIGRETGDNTESLGRHIGVGAYNSINAVALATGGASLVDRSVVDVLGIAGAAQVLARRLHKDLTPEEMETTRQAMERFHVDHYMALSDQALREAREWHEMAHEIEIGEAATGAELETAQELNAKRRGFVQNAQRVLGTALGEMEANAALVLALAQTPKDQVQVSLGRTSIEQAILQARAIGLDRGEYQIERAGASTMLTVSGGGLDKLTQPVSKEDLARVRGSLDIIEGRQDEADWLPQGVARRPDLALNPKEGVAPRLGRPFPAAPADVGAAIGDYIGGRAADGDAAADIVAGLLSEDVLRRAGDRPAFIAALDKIAPLYGADGKMVRAEAYQGTFEKLADDFVARTYGADRTPLHHQQFPVDQVAVEALHRALSEHPDGIAAFKPIGELTPQDQRALRQTFLREYGRSDPEVESLRTALERAEQGEPARETEDMFGRGVNPEWREWKTRRDDAAERLNQASMTWGKYLAVMGSPARAYAAMQDVVKSSVLAAFAGAHNRLRADAPLKVGKVVISNDLDHLDALDPGARERRLAQRRQLIDSLRDRVAGRYAAGAVGHKIEAARAAEEATNQAQMGLFGEESAPEDGGEAAAPELGERYTIGHAAERQIAGMMDIVGRNFRPGEPAKVWQPTMSGAYAPRQRAVKLIEHNGRTVLGMGLGSGKTSIMLSAFSDLHAKGKAHRGLFLVPSIVQGQFHGQALQILEPGKYTWQADPSATRAQRIRGYKDRDTHFSVVTHQAFRDDMLHLAALREGTTAAAVIGKLRAMPAAGRRDYMRDLLRAEGIDHDYLAVDEGHNLLNRTGKQNSEMADVIDAVSASMPYYVSATADPVKNDASEAFDVLAKMDPERYRDREAFMRRYGVDTGAARDELKREMARYLYTGSIDPGVQADHREVATKLSPAELAQVRGLDEAAAGMRLARMRGGVDVDAAKLLSPASFEGVDPAQHEAVAREIQRSVGIAHAAVVQHAISGESKTEALAQIASERRGRPGVVFAHALDRVKQVADRLAREGHRVVALTGGDSSAEKDRKRRAFQAGQHDILVSSDAGAVGANLQRGKWLVQYDTPMTAMTHAQRNGRINRMGQTEDVELLALVADHPAERRARDRLAKKYELRSIMSSPLDGLDDTGIAGYLQRVRAGQMEAAQPAFRRAAAGEAPERLAAPDQQQSMF